MKFFSYIYGTISDRANYAWDGSIQVVESVIALTICGDAPGTKNKTLL